MIYAFFSLHLETFNAEKSRVASTLSFWAGDTRSVSLIVLNLFWAFRFFEKIVHLPSLYNNFWEVIKVDAFEL